MEIAKRGRAAVTVCSSTFAAMGRATAAKLGFAGLPIVVVPHPFGLRARDEVRLLAEACARDLAALTGAPR